MKKFLITISIVGMVLLLLGAGTFAVVFGLNGWDIRALDPEELTPAYFVTDKQIDTVNLTGNWFFEIEEGEGFRIDYFTSSYSTVTVATSRTTGGYYTLNFVEERNVRFPSFGFAGIMRRTAGLYTVRITVTRDIALTVSGSGADVTIRDFSAGLNGVSLSGSSAALNLADVDVAGNIALSGSNLWMNIENVNVSGNISATGSSMRAYLTDVKVSGNIRLGGSNLRATMTDVGIQDIVLEGSSIRFSATRLTAQNIRADGSNMEVTLLNSYVSRLLRAQGSSARITLRDSAVREVYIPRSSNVQVNAYNSHMHTLNASGSSVRAVLRIAGTIQDVSTVAVSGSNARIYLDGTRQGAALVRPGGEHAFMHFSLEGSSARIQLTMLGSDNRFAE